MNREFEKLKIRINDTRACTKVNKLGILLKNDSPLTNQDFDTILELSSNECVYIRQVIPGFIVDLVENRPQYVPRLFSLFVSFFNDKERSIVRITQLVAPRFIEAVYEWLDVSRKITPGTIHRTLERIREVEETVERIRVENMEPWEVELNRAEKANRPAILLSLPYHDLEKALIKSPTMKEKLGTVLEALVTTDRNSLLKDSLLNTFFSRRYRLTRKETEL